MHCCKGSSHTRATLLLLVTCEPTVACDGKEYACKYQDSQRARGKEINAGDVQDELMDKLHVIVVSGRRMGDAILCPLQQDERHGHAHGTALLACQTYEVQKKTFQGPCEIFMRTKVPLSMTSLERKAVVLAQLKNNGDAEYAQIVTAPRERYQFAGGSSPSSPQYISLKFM